MIDVLVIGGGLAGTAAALAAQKLGANVALASRSWGATAMTTGALDVAFTPAFSPRERKPRTLREHVQDIIAHRQRHPYGVLGQAQAEACITAGFSMVAPALQAQGLDMGTLDFDQDNRTYPTTMGSLAPAATAFAAHGGFTPQTSGRWGILSLAGEGYFNAKRVARGISHDAAAYYGSILEFTCATAPGFGDGPIKTARSLDDEASLLALGRVIQPQVQGCAGLLCPPVLGLHRHEQARSRLADMLQMPVVEAVGHLPSVPGVRLQMALTQTLKAAGVRMLGEIVAFEGHGRVIASARTADNIELPVSHVVLASGRFICGGVVWAERCQEALFGLPVVTELGPLEEDSPHNVVRKTPVESHPLMTAGVQVNRDLQPVAEGRVAWDNLYAAGMIIGGFASRYALCADGVALGTGWLSGTEAARRAMRS